MAGLEGLLPIQQSFNGGELSPLVAARIDQTRYLTGCKTMLNAYPLVQGPVTRRPGTRFLGETKFPDKKTRIIPFIFSEDQARILEMGDRYIRFWTENGYIMGGESATKTFNHSINGNTGWDFSGAGGKNFVVPVTGTYELECVGGGGGALKYEHSEGGGGGGGGYAKVTAYLTEGSSVGVTVGGGGSSLNPYPSYRYPSNGVVYSGTGGTSSIGAYLSANGGGGVRLELSSAGTDTGTTWVKSINGGVGGTGNGGIVATGGTGGAKSGGCPYVDGGSGHLGYGSGGGFQLCYSAISAPAGNPGFCRIKYVGQ